MQLEDLKLSEVSQAQKDKSHVFPYIWKIKTKDKRAQRQARSYTNSHVEHISSSGTTLWNLEKEGKEKSMIEHQ
jgi:hypothetical protein